MRLDNFLVDKRLAESRSKAQYYIKSGVVKVNELIVKKNSYKVLDTDQVELVENPCIFVSRGGLKLEKAIKEFKIDFNDKVVLDIGASTGGFTDCALIYGAKKVYAVDVGHGQLHRKLTSIPEVVNLEGVNLKALKLEMFPDIDIAVADVSFISLTHVFKVLTTLLTPNSTFIALIKPQFESGKKGLSKGVVKHAKQHIRILDEVINSANFYGFQLANITYSPYKGQAGNIEFLANFIYSDSKTQTGIDIKLLVDEAHNKLRQ